MRRYALACSLVALAPAIAVGQQQMVMGRPVYVEGHDGDNAYVTALSAPAPEAFDALRLTYATLKIPTTSLDPNRGLVGTTQWTTPHWLAGHELSRYFDCGSGRGQSADEQSVKLTIQSTVSPDSSTGKSSLRTSLTVTATDPGESSRPRSCQSTGALETRVSDELVKTLSK